MGKPQDNSESNTGDNASDISQGFPVPAPEVSDVERKQAAGANRAQAAAEGELRDQRDQRGQTQR